MEDKGYLHCKICNLSYINFDEMQRHVKDVHWTMFLGDATKQENTGTGSTIIQDIPKPFEGLINEKKLVEPEKPPEFQKTETIACFNLSQCLNMAKKNEKMTDSAPGETYVEKY